MKMRTCIAAVLLLCSLEGGAAASLRAAPQKAEDASKDKTFKNVPAEKQAKAVTEAATAVTEQVAATIAKALAANNAAGSSSASTQKAAEVNASQPVQHKKLDVGFSDFENNLTEEVSEKLLRTATGTAWNDDMRAKFAKNVTAALKESMKVILQPVKKSIGKTWMALPKDEQKDEYVETLKKSFESVFERSLDTIKSHLKLSLKRVEEYAKEKTPLSSSELLEKSEFSITDSLITEHCYEVNAKKSLTSMKKPSNTSELRAEKKKFCIQSVVGALAHRLNDTQGLISMSMRFDSGAMSLAQQKHKSH